MKRARAAAWAGACATALVLGGCGASSPADVQDTTAASLPTTPGAAPSTRGAATSMRTPSTATPTVALSSKGDATPTTATPTTAVPSTAAPTSAASSTTPASAPSNGGGTGANGTRPVIVIDPGHSRTVHHIDKRTGLNVSDYENEPEMRDVYKVALIVRRTLQKAGYRVVMTKKSLDQRVDLATRAHIANRVHAALAISIHDQAGANGGIGFRQGNNTVYYQSVGTYRETPGGKKVFFRDKHLAKISKEYGQIFRRQRADAQRTHVNLQDNVGYNLGSRGLAPGNIWIVQLLSKVPWIYNEAGGNSAGRSGLDSADRHTYARGLVAGVEQSVPLPND